MSRTSKVTLIALAVVLAMVGLAQAEEMTIEAGYNFLATSPGSYTTISLPAGFFGEKNGTPSDAIGERQIQLEGRPIGTLGLGKSSNLFVGAGDCHSKGGHHHCHEASLELRNVDTISKISGTTIRGGRGVSTVTLQMVALSLQTPKGAPLKVTYGDEKPSSFRAVLTLDNSVEQEVGSMTLSRTRAKGGTMEVVLPVAFKVLFTSRSGSFGPVALSTALLSDDNDFTLIDSSSK